MPKEAYVRPTTRAPKQDRSRTSLQRLMDTSAAMLEEGGYADFTLQQLSKRAKVSIGSIYHLFENKQELLREVQVRALDRMEQEHAMVVNRLRRENLTLRKLVPRAIEDLGAFHKDNAGLLRVFMEVAPTDAAIASNGKKYFFHTARDFELLLLDRRDEIRHPDPDHAVQASFGIAYAAIGRFLGLGTTPDSAGDGDWDALVEDLSMMVLFFLLGDPKKLEKA